MTISALRRRMGLFKPSVILIALSKLSAASDILVSASIAELSASSTSCDTLVKKTIKTGGGADIIGLLFQFSV